ncbi:hypothetical protein ACFCX0_38355 [Streptomyces sp. NPDC056352]|uniref:hypothetical protein n=1 Tax=Streptomyces sp. NPDC056352 TaxID=3345791 RepID=UPI0035E0E476
MDLDADEHARAEDAALTRTTPPVGDFRSLGRGPGRMVRGSGPAILTAATDGSWRAAPPAAIDRRI